MHRTIGAKGVALVKGFEQRRLTAYKDGGGVWTIGWGHTKGVKQGDTCSQGEADEWLLEDLEEAEAGVNRWIGDAPTTQNQFDAMACLTFNIGVGNPDHKPNPIAGFSTSTVLKRHKLGNYAGAANAILLWNHDNGKVVAGLTRRRAAERALYLS